MTRILAYGLLLLPLFFASVDRSSALVSEKSEKQSRADAQTLNKLLERAQSYKDNPSNETYSQLWQGFESWIHQLSVKRIDASSLCKSCQPLIKAGLKIIDTAGSGATVKIYTFSPQAIITQGKVQQTEQQANLKSETKPLLAPISRSSIETRDILIQSLDVTGQSNLQLEKSGRHKKTKKTRLRTARSGKTTVMHIQSINIPPNVEIKQASVLNGSGGKIHCLAIIGQDWQSGHYWCEGLKHISTGWVHDPDLWQQVPSFLLQSGQGKIRLSENNLVITIGSRSAADNSSNSALYELVMPFVENHFALTHNEAQDPAKGVALQFLLAVQGNRPDMAKIWLIDPQLSCIPGYLGLYNRPAGSSTLKLISMSPPLNGGVRFRLITNTKDDLIIDVGRVKSQWLVKGLFIAPADSLAREIGRILPSQTNNH